MSENSSESNNTPVNPVAQRHEAALSQLRLRYLRDEMVSLLGEMDGQPDADPTERRILVLSIANLNQRITP